MLTPQSNAIEVYFDSYWGFLANKDVWTSAASSSNIFRASKTENDIKLLGALVQGLKKLRKHNLNTIRMEGMGFVDPLPKPNGKPMQLPTKRRLCENPVVLLTSPARLFCTHWNFLLLYTDRLHTNKLQKARWLPGWWHLWSSRPVFNSVSIFWYP